MAPAPGYYLGFDFGMRRIGVATGQTQTQNASPLTQLSARDGIPQWQDLDKLMQEWQPVGLVVGIPLNMDDTPQPITFCARRFRNRLLARYHCPVYDVDERLSTREARDIAYQRGQHKQRSDAIAAQLILSTWLTTEEHNHVRL